MVLDTETVSLLHFKTEIWRKRFRGGHFEVRDNHRLPWQPRWVPGFKTFPILQIKPVPIFTLLSKSQLVGFWTISAKHISYMSDFRVKEGMV